MTDLRGRLLLHSRPKLSKDQKFCDKQQTRESIYAITFNKFNYRVSRWKASIEFLKRDIVWRLANAHWNRFFIHLLSSPILDQRIKVAFNHQGLTHSVLVYCHAIEWEGGEGAIFFFAHKNFFLIIHTRITHQVLFFLTIGNQIINGLFTLVHLKISQYVNKICYPLVKNRSAMKNLEKMDRRVDLLHMVSKV